MATEKSQWKALKDCFPHPGNGCVDKNACTHAHLGVSLWGTASGPDYCLFPSRQHPRWAWGLEAGMVARILSITSPFFAWKMPVLCAKGRTKLSKY